MQDNSARSSNSAWLLNRLPHDRMDAGGRATHGAVAEKWPVHLSSLLARRAIDSFTTFINQDRLDKRSRQISISLSSTSCCEANSGCPDAKHCDNYVPLKRECHRRATSC